MENCLLEPATDKTKAESNSRTKYLPALFVKPHIKSVTDDSLQSKKMAVKFKVTKRLTPFLLLTFILPFIFIYVSTGKEADVLFHFGLLLILEINIIFFDFALCNYFVGRKLARIWLIEAPLVFLIVSLIL